MPEAGYAEITPLDLKKRLDKGDKLPLLDVREAPELAICQLPGNVHIPMSQLQARIDELDSYKQNDIVVYCRSGGRSAQCVQYMRRLGYKAINLAGGILAWSDQVDPSVVKY